jgi:lipoate-protein ligase A
MNEQFRTGAMAIKIDHWHGVGWKLLAESGASAALNLAIDEVLTRRVADGTRPVTLRFWGWNEAAVVLGRFQSVRNEVDLDAARELGVTVVRRMSGGGAMFVQPEKTITYSLYLPEQLAAGWSIKDSYEACDRWAVETFCELGVNCWYVPLNDITSPEGKIAGAAQARKPRVVLHHTTIAYELDNDEMRRILRLGREKVSDKGIPSAVKRVSPLRRFLPLPRGEVVEQLIQGFRRRFGLTESALTAEERADAERLAAERYATAAWTYDLP